MWKNIFYCFFCGRSIISLLRHEQMCLKLVSAIFYQIFIFSPNHSPLKTVQNVFYFI